MKRWTGLTLLLLLGTLHTGEGVRDQRADGAGEYRRERDNRL